MPIFTPELEFSDDYPTIEPSLRLDFANARALDSRITFTRASTATYVGRDGLIKTAGVNEPRFDHDPATGESLGLLIEKSRTNLFTYSEAFNTDWDNIRSSDSGTTATADPEGNTTGAAYKLVANTDNNTHRLDKRNLSMSTSTEYTLSVWAKAAEYTGVSLTIADSSNLFHGIYFDLSNGTFTNGGNAHSGSMIKYPNGWYRCIATYTTPASIGFQQCLIGVLEDGTTKSYAGNNSSGIYIWGAQLEQAPFPTSYIPTSGSTATRAVDTAQINGIQFHNPSEFVLYASGRSNTGASDTSSSTTECLVSLGDTTNNYRFMLRKYRFNPGDGVNTGFTFRYRNVADGINIDMFPNYYDGQADGYDTTTIAPIWDDFNIHRSALAFEAGVSTDNIRGCADGTLVAPAVTTPGSYSTVSNPGPYTQATTLQIGNGSSSGPFNGTISEVRYYPKRLTNAQLQTLTQ